MVQPDLESLNRGTDKCFETRDSINDVWGKRMGYYEHWPEREDRRQIDEPDHWVQSACVLCSNGCACDVGVKDGNIVAIRGRTVDRVNKGRLGPKGLHASIGLNRHEDRLLYPQIRENGVLRRATWEEAMNLIVSRTKHLIKEFTPHSIAFYSTGQLMLEEYYALAIIGKAGISTNHMDGNTRLCTATAAAAMRESFGVDGQPGSYTDIDVTDTIMLVGHNMAATQTVLWSRILDRLEGPNPPKIICIDPRKTPVAEAAIKSGGVHLAPQIGTNVALLNGIERYLIKNNYINKDYIDKHVYGYDELVRVVEKYTPEYVSDICKISSDDFIRTCEIIGNANKLLSTALQGVYQTNQATGSACQINNINLIRGMIGKPGCGVLQMNGQPTAQNNRECGCDGEYTGFRNHLNPDHINDLARHWNVDPIQISHWADPTHIMDILHYIENKTIRMIWINGTNPAVSLPDLARIRRLLSSPDLFVIAQDIFPNETTRLADVVLPASMWGEKTGCFTNVDRTVHIAHRAVDPPPECRSDFDIFLDFAKRMEFKDKDGKPLINWKNTEDAFNAWCKSSKNTSCDYSGLSYKKLTGGSGIQWPCNDANPNGTERLYTNGHFATDIDRCETYGHDLETGAAIPKSKYIEMKVNGRAIIKTIHYKPPREQPDSNYPLWYTTGRVVHHFHTRTKTGRSKYLQAAEPEPYLQISDNDAIKYGHITTGDYVRVSSRRGEVIVKAKVGKIESGNVFIPFHYGYWDTHSDIMRAANELTFDGWDQVSKQPTLKFGCVRVEKIDDINTVQRVSIYKDKIYRSWNVNKDNTLKDSISSVMPDTIKNVVTRQPKQQLSTFLVEYNNNLESLHTAFTTVADRFINNHGAYDGLIHMAEYTNNILKIIDKYVDKYAKENYKKPLKTIATEAQYLIDNADTSNMAVINSLVHLYSYVSLILGQTICIEKAANALNDKNFLNDMLLIQEQLNRMTAWSHTLLGSKGPQALLVPE